MAIRNRTEEISAQLQTALAKSGAPGVRGEAEKREIASAWLELALSCAKVSVKNDADELKAMSAWICRRSSCWHWQEAPFFSLPR